jgi:hypothetical protein
LATIEEEQENLSKLRRGLYHPLVRRGASAEASGAIYYSFVGSITFVSFHVSSDFLVSLHHNLAIGVCVEIESWV